MRQRDFLPVRVGGWIEPVEKHAAQRLDSGGGTNGGHDFAVTQVAHAAEHIKKGRGATQPRPFTWEPSLREELFDVLPQVNA